MPEQEPKTPRYRQYLFEELTPDEQQVIGAILGLVGRGRLIGIKKQGRLVAVVAGINVETPATGLRELGEPVDEFVTQPEFEILSRIQEIIDSQTDSTT